MTDRKRLNLSVIVIGKKIFAFTFIIGISKIVSTVSIFKNNFSIRGLYNSSVVVAVLIIVVISRDENDYDRSCL